MIEPRRRSLDVAAAAMVALALFGAGAAHAASDELVLVPDFEFKLWVLLVLFVGLVYPLNVLIFQPIFRVLDARDEKTVGTRRRADKLAADAQAMLERYQESVAEVRRDAEDTRKQTLASARADGGAATAAARGEAEREVTRARAEIASALEGARDTLRSQSTALAQEVASRALGRPLA